jgi:hypothetical protein
MVVDKKLYIQPITILALLIIIFLQRSCYKSDIISKGKEVVKYDTIYKPTQLPSKETIKYINTKGETIYIEGKVDTVEVKVFETATDSTKTNMFIEATKIRQYKQQFNDSIADISIFAETKGELLKIAPTVTVKARLPEKKTIFAAYAGAGLYANTNLGINYQLNLKFQNKRGDLISGSYDIFNKVIFLGYDIRILNIKK